MPTKIQSSTLGSVGVQNGVWRVAVARFLFWSGKPTTPRVISTRKNEGMITDKMVTNTKIALIGSVPRDLHLIDTQVTGGPFFHTVNGDLF